MYVTVLGMEGIQCRFLVVNVTDAVGLPPGGCRMFDAHCNLSLHPLLGVLSLAR